ncbi:MAG: hypothetical protein MUF49_01915 [Oculatellaceae cyanobacterium Prado106]|jgi:hypothetical protein|nr:hypothetical protein [Oculatellaceae cyanobacterium Prado106]
MNDSIYEEMDRYLRQSPQRLEDLFRVVREQGSDWSIAQLLLFLRCLQGVEVWGESGGEEPDYGQDYGQDYDKLMVRMGERSMSERVLEAVVEVVRSRQGQPIPVGQVVQLLPGHFVTTEAQVRALVKGSSQVELFGPGLLRLK